MSNYFDDIDYTFFDMIYLYKNIFLENLKHGIKYYITNIDSLFKGLNSNLKDWDILFDCNWTNYIEGPVRPDINVYPKSNEITAQCHGGSKAATLYIIRNKCAKKFYDTLKQDNQAYPYFVLNHILNLDASDSASLR